MTIEPIEQPAADAAGGWQAAALRHLEAQLAAVAIPSSPPLVAAVRYALLGGGKRIRPMMLVAAAADNPPPPAHSPAWQLACAIECLHCYSLIHDDLPCMDNAESRRNKPSCHKAHGEAMALLAGDCLQAMAFGMAAQSGIAAAAGFLADAACAIVGGQATDMMLDDDAAASEESLIAMYGEKTGALFVCAVRMGLLCRDDAGSKGGRDNNDARRLDVFAGHFGALFQVINDINGEQADRDIGKKTIVTEYGKARAIAIARRHQSLAAAENPPPPLAAMLGMVQL